MEHVKRVVHARPEEIMPYTGKGVTAAILDTGFVMHPDLAGRLTAFKDFVGNGRLPYDDCGHGTHVAGCLCGSGGCLGGRYSGIATGANVLACKILNEKGEGETQHLIQAIQYVLNTRRLYHTRIINISVGFLQDGDEAKRDAVLFWLEKAWKAGLFVVVAAGNGGPRENSISPLGMSPYVVSVGCHDAGRRNEGCDRYSGRGPSGSRIKKPDIVAPGSRIISCNADFKRLPRGKTKNPYTIKSGTSMAVPMVSAAAALLWEKDPKLSNEEIRERILHSAMDLGEEWGKQGWGMLHVGRALNY